jgi:exonuclease VII small subunit
MKLTKAQLKQRDELTSKLDLGHSDLDEAIAIFNDAMRTAFEILQTELEKYNDVLEEAREFRDDIVSVFDDFISNKSEKWQESDKGQAAASLKDAWENLTLDQIDVDEPETLDPDIEEVHILLDELATETDA